MKNQNKRKRFIKNIIIKANYIFIIFSFHTISQEVDLIKIINYKLFTLKIDSFYSG